MTGEKTYVATDLIGNPMTFFNGLPADVQIWIIWIISACAFVFLVSTFLAFFGHGAGANMASIQRDSSNRGRHIIGIVSALGTVICVLVAVTMLYWMWF